MKKTVAVLLALTFVLLAFAACGTTEEPTTTAATEAGSVVPANEPEVTTEAATEAATEAETATEAESTTEANKKPETAAEILAAYAAVMNQAKKDGPAFNKVEYQELPDDPQSRQINDGKALVGAALKVAANFMVTEDKAKSEPQYFEKGNDMAWWPIYNCEKGCMLEDASFVKSAKCEELSNGNYKITLVLKNEVNPEPAPEGASSAPSKHGGIFGAVSLKEIDDTLKGGIVSAVFKDVTYKLVYHDCTATLIYNPENNQVESLTQVLHVSISGYAKALGAGLDIANQELINHVEFYNVKY